MNLRAFGRVLKNTVVVDLEYRFSYAVLVLSSIITLVMEWAIFAHVYKGRDSIGGIPTTSAFAFILLGMLLRTVQSLWGPVFEAIEEIREGSFRRYLLQPIFHPAYFLAQALGNKVTPLLASLVICISYKFGPFMSPSNFLALSSLPYALLSFMLSTLLIYIIYLIIVYGSFFFEESTFAVGTFNVACSLLTGSLLPLSWYPDFVQRLLHLTPLPLFGDWPLRAALGLLSEAEKNSYLMAWCFWMISLGALAVFLHRRGHCRYEAFGG
jgi:ABC-2 type transport system permease protein